jgi:hypothetical protein
MPLMRSVTSLVLAFPPGQREYPPRPLDQRDTDQDTTDQNMIGESA